MIKNFQQDPHAMLIGNMEPKRLIQPLLIEELDDLPLPIGIELKKERSYKHPVEDEDTDEKVPLFKQPPIDELLQAPNKEYILIREIIKNTNLIKQWNAEEKHEMHQILSVFLDQLKSDMDLDVSTDDDNGKQVPEQVELIDTNVQEPIDERPMTIIQPKRIPEPAELLMDKQVEALPEVKLEENDETYEIINTYQFDQPEDIELNYFLESLKLIKCVKCDNKMEFQPGEIDHSIRDPEGKELPEDSLKHFCENRLRCPECITNFCIQCRTTPYHIGFNCEEFKIFSSIEKCRFCDVKIVEPNETVIIAFKNVCKDINCVSLTEQFCDKVLPCGHCCLGYKNEPQCLVCLHPDCVNARQDLTINIDQHEYCAICYTETIAQAPSVQFNCKHVFHKDCIKAKVERRWGEQAIIALSFMECPLCNQQLESQNLPEDLKKMIDDGARLVQYYKHKADERVQIEGLDPSVAMTKLAFYECFKCKLPYYGGLKDCAEAIRIQEEEEEEKKEYRPEEYVCSLCQSFGEGANKSHCDTHGEKGIMFKCQFCCETALWFCWGTTRFCEECHNTCSQELIPCKGVDCPLNGNHPPNGVQFSLGCSLCSEQCAGVEIPEDEPNLDY